MAERLIGFKKNSRGCLTSSSPTGVGAPGLRRHQEKLHAERHALPRALPRLNEVEPEGQLREEPRRAAQGNPEGLVVRQADPGEAVGVVLARELTRAPAVRRRVALQLPPGRVG